MFGSDSHSVCVVVTVATNFNLHPANERPACLLVLHASGLGCAKTWPVDYTSLLVNKGRSVACYRLWPADVH